MEKISKINKIESLINNWNERKIINNMSFDDLFNIEGVPLWWFYRRLIVKHVLPRYINTYNYIEKNKKIKKIDQIKYSILSKTLSKLFLSIEKNKIGHMKKKKTFSKNKKAMFLSYTPHLSDNGKIFRLEKILKELKKEKSIKELVLFADPLSRRTQKKLKNLDNIYSYYDKNIEKKARLRSAILHQKWISLDDKIKNKLLKKDNVSLYQYLKYALNFFFSKEFIYLTIIYYEIFKKAIDKENIEVIITTGTSSLFEKCALAAAKNKKIPTVFVNHGIGKKSLYPDTISKTKLAVFSNIYKKRLIKLGIKENDIKIVGPVVYDQIFPYIKKKKKKENKIFVATSPFIETGKVSKKIYFERLTNILKEIKKIDNTKINIKLHPREIYYEDYKNEIKKNNLKDIKIFKPNISRDEFYKLVSDSDIFIGYGSNSALEAMIINRPVVTIDILEDIYKRTPWLKNSKATLEIGYNGKIIDIIKKALKNEKSFEIERKKTVKELCGNIDGKASKRVVSLIKELIK